MRLLAIVLVSLTVAAAGIGVSLATGAGGLVQLVAFGAQDVYLNAQGTGGVTLQTSSPTDVVTQTVTFPPFGTSQGWFYSSGVTLVTVTHGAATVYQADCTAKTYSTHQAFTESGQHPILIQNQTHTDLVLYETHVVAHGSALTIDQPNPGCSVH